MEFLSWAQLILRSIQFITKQRCVFINMGYEWVKGARVSFRISDNMETWKKVIFGKYQLKVPITISPSHMYARKYSNYNLKKWKNFRPIFATAMQIWIWNTWSSAAAFEAELVGV